MYVEPNSTIRLLHGVNLDPTYQHTIYFNTAQDQANYFIGKTKHNLTKYYFQRKDRGVVKVNIDIGELYDCNYMMFRNDSFSNKWFYAFITNVEYANNGMSYVYFMIDIMQTWFFDYDIQESFVLRDHAMTDVAGDNIVPEEVTADVQYINSSQDELIYVTKTYILASTYKTNSDEWKTALSTSNGNLIQCYTPYAVDGIAQAQNFIDEYLEGHEDAILGLVPSLHQVQMSLSRPTAINGYIPRNKKLLTGQYCRYTFELGGNIMEIPLDVVPNPTVTSYTQTSLITPGDHIEYRVWLSNYANAAYPTSMSLFIPVEISKWAYNDYANTVALQADATSKMLARERVEYGRDWATSVGSVVSASAQEAGSILSVLGLKDIVNPGAAASRILNQSVNTANTFVQEGFNQFELATQIDKHSEALSRHRANMQASATGATVNSMELMKYNQLYLSGYVWTVLRQDAERIDKYFDMYGYAQNVMKIPNRNGRTHWNYVRTSGLEFHSRCPQEDMMNIVKIYENGITFWNNGDEIGNYSLDNTLH